MNAREMAQRSETVRSIVEEVASITGIEAANGVCAQCHSVVLAHPNPTRRAYLLLHGYANCPAQYTSLAQALYGQGSNVYVPLAPAHGRADHSSSGLSDVSAAEIASWVSSCVARAAQLGEELVVLGFSFGGVAATWAAMNLNEVDEVLLLAPAFLPYGWPSGSAQLLLGTIRRIPDRHIWWDPIRRKGAHLAPHVYEKYTSRGIGSVFELAHIARSKQPKRTRSLTRATLVINDNDYAINPRAAQRMLQSVIAPQALETRVVHVPSSRCWPHDFIDPLGPNARDVAEVTRFVLDLLGEFDESGVDASGNSCEIP